MRPLIIALGRSDNHAFVAAHAHALGIAYLPVEGFEASDFIQDSDLLRARFARSLEGRTPIIAAIDSSVASSTFRSFVAALDSVHHISSLVRTEPDVLQASMGENPYGERGDDPGSDLSRGVLALSIARSPHGQIATWPLLQIDDDESARPLLPGDVDLDAVTTRLIRDVGQRNVVGVITFFIDPDRGSILGEEFGVAKVSVWSESASYTTISEQMVRTILDLPLGDARLIDFEEFYLREEVELGEGTISDPIRPFLHLFARNPRLKVSYPAFDDWTRCTISLFGSSEEEALSELAHAREFMLGIDEESMNEK